MIAPMSIRGIGYSVKEKKWFVYNTSIDYERSKFFKKEDQYTIYYDTFDDASIQLGIIQENQRGGIQ